MGRVEWVEKLGVGRGRMDEGGMRGRRRRKE